ncbi:MAG TPA: DUF488 domain-containing protein [Candidatus Aquilonibacter sp.]|nr:DUF488 domain-containing protein [Candidatus Aquilonibacter sp.]
MTPELFTIGHSTHSLEKFLELLRLHRIEAVADVRSSPFSQYNPQFNREPLQRALREQGISYVFLGGELGARRSEPECYVNGRADYALIAQTPAFARGFDRIVQGAAKMRIAIMCAEKDPLDCHRCILVSPRLSGKGIKVQHIHSDGSLESQEQAERRLVEMFDLAERELFRSSNEIVAEAYRLQGERIAYQEQEDALALREKPPKYGA